MLGRGGVCTRYIPRLKGTDEDLQQHQHRGGSGSSVGGLNVIKTYALAKLIHKYTHTHTQTHTSFYPNPTARCSDGGWGLRLGEVRARGIKGLGNVTAPQQPTPPAVATTTAAFDQIACRSSVTGRHKVFYSFGRINLRAQPIRPMRPLLEREKSCELPTHP